MSDINRNTIGKFIKKLTVDADSLDADILRLQTEIEQIKKNKEEKMAVVDIIKSIMTSSKVDVVKLLSDAATDLEVMK